MMMRLPLGSMSLCFVLSGIAVQAHTQAPTWENGVANIIQAKCAPCHKPGEAAPFALTSYEQVSRRGSFIKQVIENGYMPPWKPDKHYVQYDNDRSLTAAEKKILLNWIENKMPRGNAAPTPPAPVLIPKLNTNYHRLPDSTITMQTPFVVPGDSYERFVIVKIPIELPDSANVEAIEFVSNNKKLIHHVNYSIHPVAEDIPLNLGPNLLNLAEEDPALSEQWKPFKKTISYYGGWIPGASFEAYPKGMGWVMPKRGVMLLTLHFAPSAVTDSCIAGINLFYTSQPVLRKVKVISFGSGGIGEAQISP
ncbi:MAG TPA: cytochrome c, partial [Phnomibacter sp.]|nr:cytochrome c [Phnomibacter sp.]